MENIDFESTRKWEVVDITDLVEKLIPPDENGFCFVRSPHTTAALLVGDTHPNLIKDYERTAQVLLADARPFLHAGKDGPNAEGHVFSWLHGSDILLPVENGKLKLGKLQRILFVDTDGPRKRRVTVKMMPRSK